MRSQGGPYANVGDPSVNDTADRHQPPAVAPKPPTFARFCASAALPVEIAERVRRAVATAWWRRPEPKRALWTALRGETNRERLTGPVNHRVGQTSLAVNHAGPTDPVVNASG